MMLRLLRLSRAAWKWNSRFKPTRRSIFRSWPRSTFKAPQQSSKISPQPTCNQAQTTSPQNPSKFLEPNDAETARFIGIGLILTCALLTSACIASRSKMQKFRPERKNPVSETVQFESVARGIVKDNIGNVYERVEPEFGPGLGMRVITPVRRSAD